MNIKLDPNNIKITFYNVISKLKFSFAKLTSNLSVFNKFFYGIIFIVFFTVTISASMYYFYSKTVNQDQTIKSSMNLVENINEAFEDKLDQVDRIISSFYADQDRQELLATNSYADINDQYTSLKKMTSFFEQLLYLEKDFRGIYVYISETKNFSYTVDGRNKMGYNPAGEEWFKKTFEARGKTVILSPHEPYQYIGGKVISFSRTLVNFKDSGFQHAGVMLIDFSTRALDRIVKRSGLNEKTNVIFLDSSGEIIYSISGNENNDNIRENDVKIPVKSEKGKFVSVISGKKYFVTFSTSGITGWRILTLTPYSEFVKDAERLLVFSLAIAVAAMLVAVFISYSFSIIMFKPIKKMQKGMEKVKNGNFDIQLSVSNNDELGQLVQNFNSMVSTIKNLILEKYEEKIARREAEFKYLQAQINPHFIYNTLQIISSMAVVNRVPDIKNISKALAKLIRYSVDAARRFIPVKDEMDNLISYLDIQKIRFKDFINYEIQIDENVYHYDMLKFVLQPIVENSITHGIESKGTPGLISISAQLMQDNICIEVTDNGAGMSKDKLEELVNYINLQEENEIEVMKEHNNIGLRNINKRLKIIYGELYGLKIDSVKNQWTKVMLCIPTSSKNGGGANDKSSHS